MNRWDTSENSILQQPINNCTIHHEQMDLCPVLHPLVKSDYPLCRPESPMPVEDAGLYGPLKKLPGDNSIWGGRWISDNPPLLFELSGTRVH